MKCSRNYVNSLQLLAQKMYKTTFSTLERMNCFGMILKPVLFKTGMGIRCKYPEEILPTVNVDMGVFVSELIRGRNGGKQNK